MRRPNLTALALSAMIVGSGLAMLLGAVPLLPALAPARDGEGSSAGLVREAPPAPIGCRTEERVPFGGHRFEPNCGGQAPSFDGAFLVVKNAGTMRGVGLVRGGSGASLDDLGVLDNGRPFTIFWSPNAQRFFANEKRADELDRMWLYAVRNGRLLDQPALRDAAIAAMRARQPCAVPDEVAVSGMRWSGDGKRIVLLASLPRQACDGRGGWRPLWMIGDAQSGRIDPASIRIRHGRSPLPADGPYATL